MKPFAYLLAILIGLTSINADALNKAAKKQVKKPKSKKSTQVVPAYVIAIGYPTITVALNAVQERSDVVPKPNSKPFGWQDRSGPWYVAKEGKYIEWAFTKGGHYAHPSVVKRMIDVGSKDHVYVDMAYRCASPNVANCDQLSNELKDVNLFIRKVYQKQYIVTNDGTPTWTGVDSLE